MSKKFVRSVKNVTDIEQFSKNVLEENDIISTQDGKVYVVSKNGFIELGGSVASEDVEKLQNDISTLDSSNTQLKKDITALKTSNTYLKKSVETLETQATDFESRIKALETPAPTE